MKCLTRLYHTQEHVQVEICTIVLYVDKKIMWMKMKKNKKIIDPPFKYDETMIQTLIWRYYNWGFLIPNIYTDKDSRTEIDAMHVTNAGYPIFFEIKISKSDFKADLKKTRHKRMCDRDKYEDRFFIKPKQFWYVIYGFDIDISEIPEYAGLVVVDEWRGFTCIIL